MYKQQTYNKPEQNILKIQKFYWGIGFLCIR